MEAEKMCKNILKSTSSKKVGTQVSLAANLFTTVSAGSLFTLLGAFKDRDCAHLSFGFSVYSIPGLLSLKLFALTMTLIIHSLFKN